MQGLEPAALATAVAATARSAAPAVHSIRFLLASRADATAIRWKIEAKDKLLVALLPESAMLSACITEDYGFFNVTVCDYLPASAAAVPGTRW